MQPAGLIDRLERFPPVLRAAALCAHPADARWSPSSANWSIIEIARHLLDEEREDFRVRLGLTLAGLSEWPPIDPAGWAVSRRYHEAELAHTLDEFEKERAASVSWLRSLGRPDQVAWDTTVHHPRFGSATAASLLAAWAAHDALHLRQIAKRLYELACRDGHPHPVDYAGAWGA